MLRVTKKAKPLGPGTGEDEWYGETFACPTCGVDLFGWFRFCCYCGQRVFDPKDKKKGERNGLSHIQA